MLQEQGIIDDKVNSRLKSMVGFRNIAVHDYQVIQIDILKNIIDHHLDDFIQFTEQIKQI